MALSATGVEVFVGQTSTREVVAAMWVNGTNIKIYDDCTTTTTEYRGMPEAQAKAKCASLSSNTLSDYRITGTISGGGTWWMTAPMAKGTKVTASCRRVGDSRMFTVTAVTEVHVCSNSGGGRE